MKHSTYRPVLSKNFTPTVPSRPVQPTIFSLFFRPVPSRPQFFPAKRVKTVPSRPVPNITSHEKPCIFQHSTSHLVSERCHILKDKWSHRLHYSLIMNLSFKCGQRTTKIMHHSLAVKCRFVHICRTARNTYARQGMNERSCQSRYRVASGPRSLTGLAGSKLRQIRFYTRKELLSYVRRKRTSQLSRRTDMYHRYTPGKYGLSHDIIPGVYASFFTTRA